MKEEEQKGRLEYNCPICSIEINGGFGQNVTCPDCNKTFETDNERIGDNIVCWITQEVKKL